MTLFQRRKFCAQHGMLLADALGLGLGAFQLLAHFFESLFACGAVAVFLFDEGLILRAILMRALFFVPQTLQFEPRHGDPRVSAMSLLGGTAKIVIERYGVLLARLLQLAETFEFPFKSCRLALERVLFSN